MRCNRIEALLDAYFDGELPRAEATALKAHVESCGACAARHDAEVGFRTALERVPFTPPRPGFTERALANAMLLRRRTDRLPRRTWPVAAAAITVAVVAWLVLGALS